jgi:heme o synthase
VTKKAPGAVLQSVPFSYEATGVPGRLADYVSLTKPRLNFLVVVTAAVGYYLGTPGPLDALSLVEAAIGTALVAGGAAGLNQVHERATDRLMWRTRTRPLAAERLSPAEAMVFSLVLSISGGALLATRFNLLSAILAALTLVTYTAVYTPMKRRSQLATLVGAIPGALPPMIGWAAASGSLSPGAWILFAIVFLWQIPHFMAIAWLYREDFRRAGFPLLPVVEPDGKRTGRQAVIFSVLLVPVSLLPFAIGMAGATYVAAALAGSLGLLALAVTFAAERTDDRARRLFIGSISYLPLLWLLLILNRT